MLGIFGPLFYITNRALAGDHWDEQRDRYNTQTNRIESGKKQISDEVAKQKAAIDSTNINLKTRYDRVIALQSKLLNAAQLQLAHLREETASLQRLSRKTRQYLDERNTLIHRHQELVTAFLSYQATESFQLQNRTQQYGAQSESAGDLIRPMMQLCKTTKTAESACFHLASDAKAIASTLKNAHRFYLSDIASLGWLQNKYQVASVDFPVQMIQQLENIAAYSEVRAEAVTRHAKENLPKMTQRIDQLLKEAARVEAVRIYERHQRWQEGMDFFAIVKELGNRQLAVLRDPSQQKALQK
jgi:hypothetical protein